MNPSFDLYLRRAIFRPSHRRIVCAGGMGDRAAGLGLGRASSKEGSVKKMQMGKIVCLGVAALAGFARAGNLNPGDVAVVQVQGSGDSFSWVALNTIPGGTVLSWTDEGWLGPSNTANSPSGGGFSGNGTGEQGFNLITVPGGGIPAGTVSTVSLVVSTAMTADRSGDR